MLVQGKPGKVARNYIVINHQHAAPTMLLVTHHDLLGAIPAPKIPRIAYPVRMHKRTRYFVFQQSVVVLLYRQHLLLQSNQCAS
jgi:hypothetical protein